MADVTFEVEGLDELIKAFERAPEVVEAGISRTMQASLDAFKQAVQVEWPVNYGTGKASTTTQIDGTPVDLTGRVSTPLIYGWPVEDGRAAGRRPPIEAIELWVIRKGFQWSYTDKRSGTTRPMTTHQMAYVIARAIGRGTSRFQKAGGAKMFQQGFDNALPHVNALWDNILDEIVNQI